MKHGAPAEAWRETALSDVPWNEGGLARGTTVRRQREGRRHRRVCPEPPAWRRVDRRRGAHSARAGVGRGRRWVVARMRLAGMGCARGQAGAPLRLQRPVPGPGRPWSLPGAQRRRWSGECASPVKSQSTCEPAGDQGPLSSRVAGRRHGRSRETGRSPRGDLCYHLHAGWIAATRRGAAFHVKHGDDPQGAPLPRCGDQGPPGRRGAFHVEQDDGARSARTSLCWLVRAGRPPPPNGAVRFT